MSTPAHSRADSLLLAEKRMLEAIANKVSLPGVLDDLCRTIDAHVPGVISSVALMDPDGKRLWLAAGPRFPVEVKQVAFPWPIGPNRGACGTAVFLKERVIISDIKTDPRWPDDCRAFPMSHGLRAAWSEPLVSNDGAVLGTFAMYYGKPRVPTSNDLELIEAAGHIALIAIQMERWQAAVRESEERFRLAMQAGKMYAFDWDVATDVIVRSEGSSRILGLTGVETRLTKRELLARVHTDDREIFTRSLAECTPERPITQLSYRLLQPDGSVLWLERTGHAFFNEQGKMMRMIGMVTDITERKLAEEKLQEYERAVEGVEEMIVVVDRDYRYLIANETFLKMRNMTKEQVVGRSADEVLNTGVFQGVLKEKLDECFQGKVVRFEMKYTYPEFGERDIFVSYFPIEGASGVDRVACIVQDITERKRAEEALSVVSMKLIEAQEEERTRIARELHDDIGQRIALLAVNLKGLKKLRASATDLGQRLEEASKQVGDLGKDIQTLSHRLHSPNLEYLGLAVAAGSFCREFSDVHNVTIDFHSENVTKDLPHDVSICLFRVLQEAVQNATKHSGSRQFEVSLKGGAKEIELTVHDSGRGFDPEEAIKGRGLGLTSMRERLKLVNGNLSIESQLGRGTKICARVPRKFKGWVS